MSSIEALPPIRLAIEGEYWDAQIYASKLVLFGMDGSLLEMDWRRFVRTLGLEKSVGFMAEAALIGSESYYRPDMQRLIQDPEIQPIIVDKLRRVQASLADKLFNPLSVGRLISNPLPFPHNDSDFYKDTLYVGSRSGVFEMVGTQRNRSSRKLSDVPALDIATKHHTIALAAGADGLIELRLPRRTKGAATEFKIPSKSCNTCEWTFASVVCSDQARSLYLAAFSRVMEQHSDDQNQKGQFVRHFEGIIPDTELFGPQTVENSQEEAIQWGAKDKIFRYRNGKVVVLRRSPANAKSGKEKAREIPIENIDLKKFVSVRVAPFGSVLEFDDRLVAILNSGETLTFPGEPVNWRVYPRSLNYLNHLHVIYEDRLEIIAFANDYFTPTDGRTFGIEPFSIDENQSSKRG